MTGFDYSSLRHCGKDVQIDDNVVIKRPDLVSLGDHVAIGSFTYISTALEVGDYVHITTMISIIGGAGARCVFGDFTAVGSDDFLGSGLTHPAVPAHLRSKVRVAPVVLEKHALLGTNSIVHPGVTIGEGAATGSGCLVTRDLEPWKVYVGSPARVHKDRDRETLLAMEKRLYEEQGS